MNPKVTVLVMVLASVLSIPSAVCAEVTGQQRAQAAGRGLIGSPAPRLVLKTINGETIDLADLYGKKAVYIKFWATWCTPCREQMPHFQHTYETAGSDLAMIAVNAGFNDSVEEIQKYRQRLRITMPIVMDDGRMAAALNLRVTPQHIVIGRDGRIQYVGHLADAQLDAALHSARAPGTKNHGVGIASDHGITATHQLAVGEALPTSVVRTLGGRDFSLQKRGLPGPTVLVFLSPWCESYLATTRPVVAANCRVAREQVARLGNREVRWLGIASGLWANSDDLRDYRAKYKVSIPLTLDESGSLFRQFGVTDTPTLIVSNSQGTIIRRIESGDMTTLPRALQGL